MTHLQMGVQNAMRRAEQQLAGRARVCVAFRRLCRALCSLHKHAPIIPLTQHNCVRARCRSGSSPQQLR